MNIYLFLLITIFVTVYTYNTGDKVLHYVGASRILYGNIPPSHFKDIKNSDSEKVNKFIRNQNFQKILNLKQGSHKGDVIYDGLKRSFYEKYVRKPLQNIFQRAIYQPAEHSVVEDADKENNHGYPK